MSWRQRATVFDLAGTLCFLPMVVCLLLALQWGGSTYAWSNGRIIALFVVFGLLLIAFVLIQWKAKDNATLPFRIIQKRSIAATSWFALCLGAAFFVFVYYIPIWFQVSHIRFPLSEHTDTPGTGYPGCLGLAIGNQEHPAGFVARTLQSSRRRRGADARLLHTSHDPFKRPHVGGCRLVDNLDP